jgi:hypothetical protein
MNLMHNFAHIKNFEIMAPVFWDMTPHKLMITLKKEAALSFSNVVSVYRIHSRNNLRSLLGSRISFSRARGRQEVSKPFFRQYKCYSFMFTMTGG